MHHYFEAITNPSGDSLVGYYARVINPSTQSVVTLSADDNGTPISTVSGVDNMATTDAYGNLSFYVVPGTYHLDIYAPNATSFIFRVPNVGMSSTKGDPGPPGDPGPQGEGLAEVMAPTGATKVGFTQTGTGAVTRTANAELADYVSVKQFGATGSGFIGASEAAGFNAALARVRNAGDASFSTSVQAPDGIYRASAPVSLPQTSVRMEGTLGAFLWGAAGQNVVEANGASYVLSDLAKLRLIGGVDGFHIGTAGEIASLTFTDCSVGGHTGKGWYFTGGLTSAKFTRGGANGGTKGMHSAGGINNNNVVRDYDWTNVTGNIIHMQNLTQGLLIDNNRVENAEGSGRAATAVFNFDSPTGVVVSHGWYEGVHEIFAQTSNGDDGVFIEGVTVIGSRYRTNQGNAGTDTGFIPVKWATGNDRIIFGPNWWPTGQLAPLRCFIGSVNKNLVTDGSIVHTRALKSSEHIVTKKFSLTSGLSATFLRLTRSDTANVGTNQQVVGVTTYVTMSGYNNDGTPSWAIWKVEIGVHAIANIIDDPNISITTTLIQGTTNGITLTVQKVANPTETQVELQMVFAGLNLGLNNYIQSEMSVRNLSSHEGGRFAIVVL